MTLRWEAGSVFEIVPRPAGADHQQACIAVQMSIEEAANEKRVGLNPHHFGVERIETQLLCHPRQPLAIEVPIVGEVTTYITLAIPRTETDDPTQVSVSGLVATTNGFRCSDAKLPRPRITTWAIVYGGCQVSCFGHLAGDDGFGFLRTSGHSGATFEEAGSLPLVPIAHSQIVRQGHHVYIRQRTAGV